MERSATSLSPTNRIETHTHTGNECDYEEWVHRKEKATAVKQVITNVEPHTMAHPSHT